MSKKFSQLVADAEKFPKLLKVPMFRVGDYGEKGKYTEPDLDAMANSYDPSYLEAPVTRDHVEYGPADGWIDRVYREGDTLFGDWTVHPDTLKLLQEGRFKRRSIEFYRKHTMPDGRVVPYVKACSILGAATPHCKGMPNIEFADDGESLAFDFESKEENETLFSKGKKTMPKFNLPAQYARFANRFTDEMSEEEKSAQFASVLEEIAAEQEENSKRLAEATRKLSEKETEVTALSQKVEEQGKTVDQILADNRRTKAEARFDAAIRENRESVTPVMERYLKTIFMHSAETPLAETMSFKESDTAEEKRLHFTDVVLGLISELPKVVSLSTPTVHNLPGLNRTPKFIGRPDPEDKDAMLAFNDRIMKEAEALCKEDPALDLGDAMIAAERRLTGAA